MKVSSQVLSRSGTIIDIPYLKQLAIHKEVPVAYCKKPDIDIVENFVPAFLYRFIRHQWQLLDHEDYIISQHYRDEGDDSINNLFGTYIQHPEETFVQYFGRTPAAAFDEGSTSRSPRKNPEAFEFEQGTSPHCSPRKNPEQGSPTQPEKSQFIRTSEATVEIDMDAAAAVAAETATVTAAVVVNPATRETTATETTAAVTKAASTNNTNTRLNVQAHPRKANYRQLPLNKHRPSTVYYHSAFTTYPRHNRP